MNPTAGDVHVNVPLTNISVAYIQEAKNFVADKVFPVVPVQKQSDKYFVYSRDDFFRSEAQLRGPSTESAGSGWKVNTDSYYADVYAVHKDVDDQIRANTDAPLNMDRDATLWVTQQMLLKRDLLWQSSYFKTGVWTGASNNGDLTGVASAPNSSQFVKWDVAGSTPIEDIRKQIFAMGEKTGFMPNTLVLGANVWKSLQDHAEFLDRIKYTQKGIVSPDLLAAVLDISKVVVSSAVSNSSIESVAGTTGGFTDGTNSFVLGKSALLAYVTPSPSLMTPSAGYTFSWTGFIGAGPSGNRIKTFRMEWLESDRVEGELAIDSKAVAKDMGAFFSGAVS